jgi:hypothetical protein
MLNSFKGPLGSHFNYITHIALQNQIEYMKIKKRHEEDGSTGTSGKYEEFRLFLNAIESFNNIIDYLYFEHEDQINYKDIDGFRKAIHKKYPELGELSDLANAYKHCVRTRRGEKNDKLPWARDLQAPRLDININVSEAQPSVKVEYEFPWPLEEHESKLFKALDFWLAYHRKPNTEELINA